jgi:hypothetical protein
MTTPKFELGQLVATANAAREIDPIAVAVAINRHSQGDWGDLDEHDRKENDWSLAHGERLLSVYYSSTGKKFWVITERDRSVTTVLLPEDY